MDTLVKIARMNALKSLLPPIVVLVALQIGLYGVLPPPQREWFVTPQRSYRLNFDQPYSGLGWHSTERDENGMTFKWTSLAQAEIMLPLQAQDDLEVRFSVTKAMDERLIEALTFYADETRIPLQRTDDLFRGFIPRAALTNPTSIRLRFIIPYLITPHSVNPESDDLRALGIALDWLDIHPLSRPGELYEFDVETPNDSEGWYAVEIDDSNATTFRWTRTTDAYLLLPIPQGRGFRVEVGIIGAITPDVLDSFSLELNGITLELEQTTQWGRQIYTAVAPSQTTSEGRFVFKVDAVYSPLELATGTDSRPLGLRVDWLRMIDLDA
jgi:hypothetical protein